MKVVKFVALLIITFFVIEARSATSPVVSSPSGLAWNIRDKIEDYPVLLIVGDIEGYNAIIFNAGSLQDAKEKQKEALEMFFSLGYELSSEKAFRGAIARKKVDREYLLASIASTRVIDKAGGLTGVVFVKKVPVRK